MNLSPIGQACLIAREGRRLMAYTDSVGVLTIGIGCTEIDGKPVERGMRITAAECDALFAVTVARFVAAVNAAIKVPVTQNAFDALVSIAYNIGIAGMAGSTFLRRINAGDTAGARDAILLWKIPAALIPRRQAEAEQFVTPYAQALPRPTTTQRPIAVPVTVRPTATPLAPAGDDSAPSAPVLAPVILPPAHPWLDRLGAWVDRLFAEPDGRRAESGGGLAG